MRSQYVWVLGLVLLTGCAEQALRKDTQEHAEICNMRSHGDLQTLDGLIPLDTNEVQNIPVKLLSNSNTPTSSEILALERYDEYMQPCVTNARQNMQKHYAGMPEIAGLFEVYQTGYKANLAQLYSSKETYGDFNKNLQYLNAKFQEAATNIVAAYQRRQQDAARDLGKVYMEQMLRTPSSTNCVGYGNAVNCITR